GGLIGLLVLWRSLPALQRLAGLVVCVPRFSNVAFFSVVFLLASGVGATVIHMPILAALWETSYGKTILVKIGLLAAAMLLGAVNLLRSKPRLVAAPDADAGRPAAALLRRTISGETLLLAAAVFAAALLPPRPRPCHGRPLGARVQRDAEGRHAVHCPRRRPRHRMNEPPPTRNVRLRLLASLVALGCGAAAAVVALLLLHTALP